MAFAGWVVATILINRIGVPKKQPTQPSCDIGKNSSGYAMEQQRHSDQYGGRSTSSNLPSRRPLNQTGGRALIPEADGDTRVAGDPIYQASKAVGNLRLAFLGTAEKLGGYDGRLVLPFRHALVVIQGLVRSPQ